MKTFAITFEVPDHQEPINVVRSWAQSLQRFRDVCPRAGECWPVPNSILRDGAGNPKPNQLERIKSVRVLVPEGDPKIYASALALLVTLDLWCLRNVRLLGHSPYPPIYDYACYVREAPGDENWQSTESIFQRKDGDCEDLACARAAERLRVMDPCKPIMKPYPRDDGSILWHILVLNPDGTEEDPSALLGMHLGRDVDETCQRCITTLTQDLGIVQDGPED